MKLLPGSFTIGKIVSFDDEKQQAVAKLRSDADVLVDIDGYRDILDGEEVPFMPEELDTSKDVRAPRLNEKIILIVRNEKFGRYAYRWGYFEEFERSLERIAKNRSNPLIVQIQSFVGRLAA